MVVDKLASIDKIDHEERTRIERSIEVGGRLLGRDEENVFLRVGCSTLEIPLKAIEDIEGELAIKSDVVVSLSPGTMIRISSEIKAEDLSMATMYDRGAAAVPVYLDDVLNMLMCPGTVGRENVSGTGSPMYVVSPVLNPPDRTRGEVYASPKYVANPVIRR